MNADHDLERRIADFYATEADTQAPDRVLESALATIDTTRQRRALIRVPWRFPIMNTYAKLAVAAVVAIAVGAIGLAMFRPSTDTGIGAPGPTPSPTVSPSLDPSAPPPLGETFTSAIHGMSISYPTGWVAVPATEAWTASSEPSFESPAVDRIHDSVLMDHLFLGMWSQPLAGKTGETWVTEFLDNPGIGCGGARQPITVGGASGLFCSAVAAVSSGDRGYAIWLYTSGDDPWLERYYDEAWFREILATVTLAPGAVSAEFAASGFRHPFDYVLPTSENFDFGPEYGPSYFEVRLPAAAQAGTPSGVIIQAVGDGKADPCDRTSARASIASGPDAVIDYLRSIPGLTVSDESAVTLSGLPARQATVNVPEGAPACPEIWPWAEGGPESMPQAELRVIAVDVGGEHVVLTVYGESANPRWNSLADEVIGSIRFAPSGG